MQMDLRTVAIKPKRHTFGHVARRIGGDKATSRYLEGVYDLQSMNNFHYRPLWDPELDHFDERRTAINMQDWYKFLDPRQYYYGTYVITRSKQQEKAQGSFDFVEQRGLIENLPADLREQACKLLIPLRHVAWGGTTNNTYITAYGFGAAITQSCLYAAMDQLGIAQFITRAGLLLGGKEGLDVAKTEWLEDEKWQGLRKLVEEMFVLKDWFELFVAQNIVLDGLLFPLIYDNIINEDFVARGGAAIAMMTQFQTEWEVETVRWSNAQIKIAAAESADNKKLVEDWVVKWRDRFAPALLPIAKIAIGDRANAALDDVLNDFSVRMNKQGIEI